MSNSTKRVLRERVAQRNGMLVAGAFNAMSARIVADQGFEAVYLTGAGLTNMHYGAPDLGIIGLRDVADATSRIRDAVELPLIVDADTGFGNAVNVWHTVRVLERAGADAIQLEDQVFPKRCGHFAGKSVAPLSEMVSKIKAAATRGATRISSSSPAPTRALSRVSTPPSSAPGVSPRRARTSCSSRRSSTRTRWASCRNC